MAETEDLGHDQRQPNDAPASVAPKTTFLQRNTGEVVAIAAFLLSLTVSVINAWYAVRGSEIVLLPPDRVIIYRDNLNDDAVARLAIPMSLINTASSDHGDVVISVDAAFLVNSAGASATFGFGSIVEPVLSELADKAAQSCELGARCIVLPSLLVIERNARLIDVPGGAARSQYLSFAISPWNCRGLKQTCDQLANFDGVARALAARPLDLTLFVSLYSDGKKQARCKTVRAIDEAYLVQTGWISLKCAAISTSKS